MEQLRSAEEQQITQQANLKNAEMAKKTFDAVIEDTKRPVELQSQFLAKLLEDNKDTEYGRKYGFAEIKSVQDFRDKVPVTTWANYEPYVDRMMKGEKNILTAYHYDHFTTTSGTSSKPKHIPYTDNQRDIFAKYNSLCSVGLLVETIGTDWCKNRGFSPQCGAIKKLPSGMTEGHVTGKIVEYLGGTDNADRALRTIYTSPIEATVQEEKTDCKYIHCLFGLEDRDVTGITVMYFPILFTIIKYMLDNIDLLIHDIETGTIDDSIQLSDECRESLLKKIKPMPERAAELKEIFKDGVPEHFLTKIWPNLTYIYGCSGGGFTTYDKMLRDRYTGEGLTRIYYGITASEGLFSIPFKADSIESVLVPGDIFLEFLPVEAEDDFSQIVTIDKLEKGKVYELIVTNAAGFYRYRMSDSVEVTGKLNNTPTVKFIGRVNKTVNMCAEKILESELENLVAKTCDDLNMPMFDFCIYPDYDDIRYAFLIEPLEPDNFDVEKFKDDLSKKLIASNDAYETAMRENRLKTLSLRLLQPETCLFYRDVMERRGGSGATIKPVHLIINDFQKTFFTTMVEE